MVKVVNEVKENLKSRFGTVNITVPFSVLDDLKGGKSLVTEIFDEYTVVISVGDELKYEEEC